MSVTGIDLGSRTIKIIEMDGQEIINHSLYDTVS